MGVLPPVIAVLDAETSQFTRKMSAAAAEMGSGSKLQGAMNGLAKMGTGVALAVVGIGVASTVAAMRFQASMELIHTQAGASQGEVDALSKSVLDIAANVAQGPNALAASLFHIESAGFRGAQALDMMKMAAEGATIGQADLEAVTQAMIGTMAAGLPDVHNATQALEFMNQIVGIGDMRMGKLAQSIATGVLPTFKNAGLTMKDYGAALATLTDNVTPADEAATRLRMSIALLSAPSKAAMSQVKMLGLQVDYSRLRSKDAKKEFEKFGLSLSQLALDMRKPDGLLVALQDVKSHLEQQFPTTGVGTALATINKSLQHQALTKMFGGGRSSGAIITLVEEMGRLQSKYVALGTPAQRSANLTDAWAATQKTFAYQVHQVQVAIETLAVRIGTWLIPIIQKVVGWIITATDWLSQHHDVAIALAWAVGTVLVAALVAATVAFLGITVPIAAVVIAIAAVAGGLAYCWEHFQTFRQIVAGVLLILTSAFANFVNFVLMVFGGIIDGAANAFGWIPGIGPLLVTAAGKFDQFRADVKDQLSKAQVVAQAFYDSVNAMNPTITIHFATAGAVAVWNQLVAQGGGLGIVAPNHTPTAGSSKPKGFAGGGAFSGGWVGEHGREWFEPRTSGTILPNWQTRQMMGGRGGEQPIVVNITTQTYSDSRLVRTEAQQYKHVNGRTALV